mmetsp:Transcript_5391/g.10268  ORF Transcript_5391/g.10268 Transcript_5391/m.10268 type:complete len:245 (-) Transcript_5391:30-764(-)
MLAADKLQLQSALKQQATALKEKEFNLHHSNLMTVGTQAAVLTAVCITMFIEFQPPTWSSDFDLPHLLPRFIKFCYYTSIVYALCCNLAVVSHTTVLAVLGTSLALRGPDGSMIVATEGLYAERKRIFTQFGKGLLAAIASAFFACFLILHWETAVLASGICVYTAKSIIDFFNRVRKNFDFDENTEAIDLSDIFAGPANIVAHPSDLFNRAMLRANGLRSSAGDLSRTSGARQGEDAGLLDNV